MIGKIVFGARLTQDLFSSNKATIRAMGLLYLALVVSSTIQPAVISFPLPIISLRTNYNGIGGRTHDGSNWKPVLQLHQQRSSKPKNHDGLQDESDSTKEGIRLNKVLKATHSRREADRLIQDGRVKVNGKVSFGCTVVPFQDSVQVDGKVITGWEQMNTMSDTTLFEYIKYWKPRGVICTTDRRIRGNIIDAITTQSGYRPQHRVYPVGRLDKDTSGLILLTSDGRLPNASLRRQQKQSKLYEVRVNRPLKATDADRLRKGVVITTVAQRDGASKPLTAATKPCQITILSPVTFEITLMEGRNRQIRKMLESLDYEVIDLHRKQFGAVTMKGLSKAGAWKRLSGAELKWVESLLA